MRFKPIAVAAVLATVLCTPVIAAEILDNAAVVKLVKAGLDAGVISSKIEGSRTNFDTSTDALLKLKADGVPSEVVQAMLRSGKARDDAVAEVSSSPLLVRDANGKESLMIASTVRNERSGRKDWLPGNHETETFITLQGQTAQRVLPSSPEFISLVNPAKVRLLHFGDNKEGGRYVVFSGTGSDREVQLLNEDIGEGRWKLTPAKPLTPGQQYAFVVYGERPDAQGMVRAGANPVAAGMMGVFGGYMVYRPEFIQQVFDFGVQ